MSDQMYTPPTDVTDDDKMMALLSYIFPLIVPLIILLSDNRKNRPVQRLHGVQSLTLTVISVIVSITVIGACLSPVIYIWGIVVGVNAYQGKQMDIPFVSNFVKKQGWVQ
ncbi:MAG: hypothetical protein ABFD14_04435 [Anaerolineaceae bacterium]|jgi:uncharacterized membrane protein